MSELRTDIFIARIAIFEKSNASILFKEIARFPEKICCLFNVKAEK